MAFYESINYICTGYVPTMYNPMTISGHANNKGTNKAKPKEAGIRFSQQEELINACGVKSAKRVISA